MNTFRRTSNISLLGEVRVYQVPYPDNPHADASLIVPCLRRATSLAYTDADEDAERLLSFGDSNVAAAEGDEWVETHAGRKSNHDAAATAGDIGDIPDFDAPSNDDGGATSAMGTMSLSGSKGAPLAAETPDLDDIPDMEEDLEGGDDEATAPPAEAPTAGVIDARYVVIRALLR